MDALSERISSTQVVVAVGIGAAVFALLGRFVSIPSGVPNTNIETSYAFLALMAVLYGPVAGFLIGFIGHALKDFVFYGSPWWSWVMVSGLVGLFLGFSRNRIPLNRGVFGARELLLFNALQIVVQGVGWGLIAPTLDIWIYAEPANKVYLQGLVAGIADIVSVGILGSLLLYTYARSRPQSGSLERSA